MFLLEVSLLENQSNFGSLEWVNILKKFRTFEQKINLILKITVDGILTGVNRRHLLSNVFNFMLCHKSRQSQTGDEKGQQSIFRQAHV